MFSRRLSAGAAELLSRSNEVSVAEHYAGLLKLCADSRDLEQGRRIHSELLKLSLAGDTYLGNLLVVFYGNCGCVQQAQSTFEQVHHRNVFSWNTIISAFARNGHLLQARQIFDLAPERTVVTWNTLISAYAQCGFTEAALELFEEFSSSSIRPTVITFLSALDACSAAGWLEKGRALHEKITRHGLDTDSRIASALVSLYGKCGSLDEALGVYKSMPEKGVTLHNSMITAFAQSGLVEEARELFLSMEDRSSVTWNAMIKTCSQNGETDRTLEFFRRMLQDGSRPNRITFVSSLDACDDVESGRELSSRILESGLEFEVEVVSALVSMHGRLGRVDEARELFDKMQPSNDVVLWTGMIRAYAQNGYIEQARALFETAPCLNVVSWTTMIGGYAQAGDHREMLRVFRLMDLEGVQPNRVTLVSVLDACADIVELLEARFLYSEIAELAPGSDVILCNALLNLLGKCGCVSEAWSVFFRVVRRTTSSWSAMITALAHNGYWIEAVELFKEMLVEGVEPNEITYVSVLTACGHAGEVAMAWSNFVTMRGDFGIDANNFHYLCMVDALGRAGELSRAEKLIETMPFQPGYIAYSSLLGACGVHRDDERALRMAESAQESGPEDSAPYVLLSNMFTSKRCYNLYP